MNTHNDLAKTPYILGICKSGGILGKWDVAEAVGFEPTVRFPAR